MDILHKVNLHIFVEFQEYVAHHIDENIFGRSIYDLTQADIENTPELKAARDMWFCWRTAFIHGASKPDPDHGKPCYYCNKPINNSAGNPSEWSVGLCHKDDPGRVKPHHIGCVMERLQQLEDLKSVVLVLDEDEFQGIK